MFHYDYTRACLTLEPFLRCSLVTPISLKFFSQIVRIGRLEVGDAHRLSVMLVHTTTWYSCVHVRAWSIVPTPLANPLCVYEKSRFVGVGKRDRGRALRRGWGVYTPRDWTGDHSSDYTQLAGYACMTLSTVGANMYLLTLHCKTTLYTAPPFPLSLHTWARTRMHLDFFLFSFSSPLLLNTFYCLEKGGNKFAYTSPPSPKAKKSRLHSA